MTAMSGRQVAVVVPTTLLARQHSATFRERFQGYPVHIAQASRLVGRKEIKEVKSGLAAGTVDIVIGTHALLAKDVVFRDLGLLVIDEEQHFGVKHKERLKELKANVHVLTLTATPIPRTLQLALTGMRELSIIATPPVDRLAVRTYISPFDPVIIREALRREHYRGGQGFYVVPRISDIAEIATLLRELVPEARVGRHPWPAGADASSRTSWPRFYDRKFDVLLTTTIIESGLDIPTANTLIVHRADMFGLAQLYQLRGRVGRSKQRAYALLTTPAGPRADGGADKRLKVLQSLDSLGAGFTLASHDLDIRGAGNLLGEEQSGHIREVGFELYQQMLEEAVASSRADSKTMETADAWSPQINIGTSVLIPEAICSRSAGSARALSPARRLPERGRYRLIRSRTARPVRRDAGGGEASSRRRRDQAPVPRCQCGEPRCWSQGCGADLPQRHLRQPRRAGRMDHRAGNARQAQARYEARYRRSWEFRRGAPDGRRQLMTHLRKLRRQLEARALRLGPQIDNVNDLFSTFDQAYNLWHCPL